MIITNKRNKFGIKLVDAHFSDEYRNINIAADLITFYQCSEASKDYKKYNTLHIDLKKSTDELFSKFDRRTKKELQDAVKYNYKYAMYENPTTDLIHEFCDFYDEFARKKSLGVADRELLINFKKGNALCISKMVPGENDFSVYHVYSVDLPNRARCIYSCSHLHFTSSKDQRKAISHLNRMLHWMDMQQFKDKGYAIYDFGGLTLDKSREDMSKIDEFKMGFGGSCVTEYHFYYPKTFLGRIGLLISGKKAKDL